MATRTRTRTKNKPEKVVETTEAGAKVGNFDSPSKGVTVMTERQAGNDWFVPLDKIKRHYLDTNKDKLSYPVLAADLGISVQQVKHELEVDTSEDSRILNGKLKGCFLKIRPNEPSH